MLPLDIVKASVGVTPIPNLDVDKYNGESVPLPSVNLFAVEPMIALSVVFSKPK